MYTETRSTHRAAAGEWRLQHSPSALRVTYCATHLHPRPATARASGLGTRCVGTVFAALGALIGGLGNG